MMLSGTFYIILVMPTAHISMYILDFNNTVKHVLEATCT